MVSFSPYETLLLLNSFEQGLAKCHMSLVVVSMSLDQLSVDDTSTIGLSIFGRILSPLTSM